jgi:hypothetical protein
MIEAFQDSVSLDATDSRLSSLLSVAQNAISGTTHSMEPNLSLPRLQVSHVVESLIPSWVTQAKEFGVERYGMEPDFSESVFYHCLSVRQLCGDLKKGSHFRGKSLVLGDMCIVQIDDECCRCLVFCGLELVHNGFLISELLERPDESIVALRNLKLGIPQPI